MSLTQKPKLVFIRWIPPDRPSYIRLHLDQNTKCLSQFFDVTVVSGDCDYDQVCELHQPDLTLFESGVYACDLPRRVSNTSAHPQVPKLGFFNGDAMCGSRSVFIADMERWGIETFFTISVSLAEYTPEIAENLYVWPNAVDSELYHDYGERKHIPILFTGSQAPHYPWRNRVSRQVIQHYPTMVCPHAGWGSQAKTSRMIFGEKYARLLNASWFVPTCGTVVHEAVRKHFEIPACKACMITEASPAVVAAGFVDGENCVYADEHDVVDKIDHLFAHPDELERIVTAGHELVHSRHTLRHRDQIFQWFGLYQSLEPTQRIIQPGPFEALRVVEDRTGMRSAHLISNGVDRVLLREGDRQLWAGRYQDAETQYRKALAHLSYLPEAKLRIALCNLLKGNAAAACKWLEDLLRASRGLFAVEPDPVEWAYYIVAHLCLGRVKRAGELAGAYPFLRHLELDRVRALVSALQSHPRAPMGEPSRLRPSVHQLPPRSIDEWTRWISSMLRACRQYHVADRCLIPNLLDTPVSAGSARHEGSPPPGEGMSAAEALADVSSPTVGVHPTPRLVRGKRSKSLRALAKNCLQRLEGLWTYFLPYRHSIIRNDALFAMIEQLSREAKRGSILIHGAVASDPGTESCLLGATQNATRPDVICVTREQRTLKKLQRRKGHAEQIRCLDLPIEAIKQQAGIKSFGLALITEHDTDAAHYDDVSGSDVIVIIGISRESNSALYCQLLSDAMYTLAIHDGAHRDGYAVFRRATLPLKRDYNRTLVAAH